MGFPGLLGGGFLVGWSLWGSGYHGPDLLGLEGIEVWLPIVHVGFLDLAYFVIVPSWLNGK